MRSRGACSTRKMIIVQPTTIATLTLTLGLAACHDAAPDPSGPPAASSPNVTERGPKPESGAPAPAPAAAPPTESPVTDPQLTAKLADLDAMCEALNRDYGDGTLGDYYAGLVPRTDWGKQQIAAGNATIQPGRLLERAVAELAPGDPLDDRLGHCRKLLEYLDEVE
jgi:hypothetical protein